MGDLGDPSSASGPASTQRFPGGVLYHSHDFPLSAYPEQKAFDFSPGSSSCISGTIQPLDGPLMDTQSFGDFSSHKLSQLQIPPSTTRRHGQYTPPTSETSPTRDSPSFKAGTLKDEETSTTERSGPNTRTRRNTRASQAVRISPEPSVTPRRRKKSSRKGASGQSTSTDTGEKRSQFLERNRVAASKCRQKKKEWTSNLETRARELQGNKNSMALLVASLREELLYLKGEALKHTTCDCTQIRNYLARQAGSPFLHTGYGYPHSPCLGSDFMSAVEMDPMIESPAGAESSDLPELDMMGQIPD